MILKKKKKYVFIDFKIILKTRKFIIKKNILVLFFIKNLGKI
jgi:hypothetical protein